MTPRQMMGYFRLAQKRRIRDNATQLSLQAVAGRSEPKELKSQFKKLLSDADAI